MREYVLIDSNMLIQLLHKDPRASMQGALIKYYLPVGCDKFS
jgi:hypothetical protein